MIESIEKLRGEIEILRGNNIDTDELTMIADAIEREVEERYIEGPTDKNGELVFLGDVMQGEHSNGGWCEPFEVHRLRIGPEGWCALEKCGLSHIVKICRHKTPTVEDVLNALCLKYVKLWNGEASKRRRQEIVAEYAAKLELREAE